MSSRVLAAVFASIRVHCACVRVPDAPAWFPAPVAPWRRSGLAPGKFGIVQPFRGILTCSGVCVGLRDSFATLCTCVHTSDVSEWLLSHSGSPVRGYAPPAGKFGATDVTDTFSGVFELVVMLCVRAYPTRPSRPWAFLASPRVVLRHWLGLRLLTFLQIFSSHLHCRGLSRTGSTCLRGSQVHSAGLNTIICSL